jgi:hypothetical protein
MIFLHRTILAEAKGMKKWRQLVDLSEAGVQM